MEHAVQMMAGIAFVVLGVSYLTKTADWIDWLAALQEKGRRGSLSLGLWAVIGGGFVLAFHPVWQGVPLILTLLGTLAVIKGTTLLLFPGWMPGKLARLSAHFERIIRIKAALTLALGLALLWDLHQNGQPLLLS